jgi:hypothetical protein
MKAANVFIGVAEGAVAAAVVADTMADAKAMLPGLEVIKMTSKTRLFVTFPQYGARKKVLLSGATKSPKMGRGIGLPHPQVFIINGRIEFKAPVYIDGMPVREIVYLFFPTRPTGDAQCQICK